MRSTRLRSEGNGGAIMSFRTVQRLFSGRQFPRHIGALILLAFFAVAGRAASIRGVVTDASGARVSGATVDLISNGSVVGSAVSGADGSFQVMTGLRGRFFMVVSATKFRQLETPGFYAGQLDNIERNIVLEPEWVHESIVVTATGTPTKISAVARGAQTRRSGVGRSASVARRREKGRVGGAGRRAEVEVWVYS